MRVAGTILLLLAAAGGCRSDLDRLERDAAVYKVEYEKMRLSELEALYAKTKEKADALSRKLLETGRERDRLYEEYDRLLAERNSVQRRIEELQAEIAALRRREREAEAELR
jgi:chromosome segregation ATPase